MAEQNGKQTPPYISFATFDNFINGLGESTVPDKIDSSLMRTLSGSARSGLMVALRYLKLIDEDGNTLPDLEKLAKLQGPERAKALAVVLGGAYGFFRSGNLDLTRATPAQLAEAIGAEGATGGTRDKAVGFFLKAAEAAGMPLSPHITKGKHARAAPAKRAKKQGTSVKKPKLSDNNADEQLPAIGARKLSEQVLQILDKKDLKPEVEKAVYVVLKHLREEGK
jgi:hypothetical protein